jgi:hypothetical protein
MAMRASAGRPRFASASRWFVRQSPTIALRRIGGWSGDARLDPPVFVVGLGLESVRLRVQEGSAFRFERVQVFVSRPDHFEPGTG